MLIFLDAETTGAGHDDRLCQIAFKTEGGNPTDERFNPVRPTSIEAGVGQVYLKGFIQSSKRAP
jgi:hypothetical protein